MTDTPADERCGSCHRLDPINCPCPPEGTTYPTEAEIFVQVTTEETTEVLRDVADERVRQVAKWGVQSWPDGTRAALSEMADAAKKRTDRAARNGTLTWLHILEEEVLEAFSETDPTRLREELVQVAAVALAWVEDIDRKAAAAREAELEARLDAYEETLRAFRESEMVGQAIADGRLPLRQPGELRVTEDGAAVGRIYDAIKSPTTSGEVS